ncbi:hypothetical protein HOY80DRAFT_1002257 [Tuber brumale]|nr:hypothetical protein HOY80DRAFT_1002257 [Tuber brumale]
MRGCHVNRPWASIGLDGSLQRNSCALFKGVYVLVGELVKVQEFGTGIDRVRLKEAGGGPDGPELVRHFWERSASYAPAIAYTHCEWESPKHVVHSDNILPNTPTQSGKGSPKTRPDIRRNPEPDDDEGKNVTPGVLPWLGTPTTQAHTADKRSRILLPSTESKGIQALAIASNVQLIAEDSLKQPPHSHYPLPYHVLGCYTPVGSEGKPSPEDRTC